MEWLERPGDGRAGGVQTAASTASARAENALSRGQRRDQATHLGGARRDGPRAASTRSPHPVIIAIIRIIRRLVASHAGAATLTPDLSAPLPPPRSAARHAEHGARPGCRRTKERPVRPCGALTALTARHRRRQRARPLVTLPIAVIADITWRGGPVRRRCDRGSPPAAPSNDIRTRRDRRTMASGDSGNQRTDRHGNYRGELCASLGSAWRKRLTSRHHSRRVSTTSQRRWIASPPSWVESHRGVRRGAVRCCAVRCGAVGQPRGYNGTRADPACLCATPRLGASWADRLAPLLAACGGRYGSTSARGRRVALERVVRGEVRHGSTWRGTGETVLLVVCSSLESELD